MHRRNILDHIYGRLLGSRLPSCDDDESILPVCATETSPLLRSASRPRRSASAIVSSGGYGDEQQQGMTSLGSNCATWQDEAKIIASYSGPLAVTFLLQYSIDALSLVAAGRVGKIELGAVSCP
jgi:MATE family multidrug resistance protein